MQEELTSKDATNAGCNWTSAAGEHVRFLMCRFKTKLLLCRCQPFSTLTTSPRQLILRPFVWSGQASSAALIPNGAEMT